MVPMVSIFHSAVQWCTIRIYSSVLQEWALRLSPVSLCHKQNHNYWDAFTCLVSTVNFLCLVAQSCLTLCNPMDCGPPGSSVHGDSPGKNTWMGFHALLQEIFLTLGSNPCLSCLLQACSLLLVPSGKPKRKFNFGWRDKWKWEM